LEVAIQKSEQPHARSIDLPFHLDWSPNEEVKYQAPPSDFCFLVPEISYGN
jgi:hypothetical protein